MTGYRQQETTVSAPIRLYDKTAGELLMTITPEQLRQLQDGLEEEFPEDHDYYINADTLDYLAARGVDAVVLDRLRDALGAREGFDILWSTGDRRLDVILAEPR
jgi:hypothetical protein